MGQQRSPWDLGPAAVRGRWVLSKRVGCGTHSLSCILTRQEQRGDYSAPLALLEKAVGRMLVGVTGSQVHPWFIQ